MPKKGKKGDNTFRFQSFSEQISNVSIDVHRNARLTSKEIPENDKDTFFRESLEKWSELNCSIDYTRLYRKLKPLSRSFNQLVYHKNQVVEILKDYLSKDESLAHEACLELLAHMSKDLLDEFYPFFDQFFPLLVKFLGNNRNTKLIEGTFICFAYIFKFLWKWMLKDLKNFFKTFSLLLSASQKHHIQVFASEAFAFLIRKSKDKPKVVKFLLEQIDGSLNEGVGHLLFQAVKGIKFQLNLAGEEVLVVILNTIYLIENDKEEVMKALRTLWISTLRHCSKENAQVLSKILYQSIGTYVSDNKNDLEVLQCYLLLLTEIVGFKYGECIDTEECLQVISTHLIKLNDDDIQELVQRLSAKLMKTTNGNLTDNHILDFVNSYANYFSKDTKKPLQLYSLLLNWYKIDLIKPSIFTFISKHFKGVDKSGYLLEFLVELVYNVDPRSKLSRPIEQQTINESLLEFEMKKKERSFHRKIIDCLTLELWNGNPCLFWCTVVVLMHTRFEPSQEDLTDLSKLNNEILEKLDSPMSSHKLLALCYLIACYQLMKTKTAESTGDLPLHKMIELVRLHPSNEHCLQAFDAYISTTTQSLLEDSSTIVDVLKENLNSPFKLNRVLTLRILDCLNSKSSSVKGVFKDCLVAEEIEVALNTYRDRMMHLQKLTFHQDNQLPDETTECVFRYLIGNFYLNFSLVWEPTTKVILSYMGEENAKINALWDVWMEILNKVTEFCEKPTTLDHAEDEQNNLSETYLKFYNVFQTEKTEYRPDYQNFRYLMWKTMSDFASVVERRSRFVMPLFFQFVENEYTQADELYSRTQNVCKEKQVFSVQEKPTTDNKETTKKNNKHKIKTLCAQLDVNKQFRDPKSISKEKRLFQLYMEFLSHKEHDVQKKTLECLYTYKFPYLKPYHEDFEKLMDDTTFREELVRICSLDEPVFKDDHKAHLMPIVIRLLYGKLQRKSGLGMSGKSGLAARRNIIMQFLAQCTNEEIKTFISLITDPLKLYKDIKISSALEDQSFTISSIVPLQRQISFCNMFSTLVTRLQKQAMSYLPELYNLLLKIVLTNSWCLEHKKDEVWPHYLTRMKELRTLGIMKLIELFTVIPEFDCQESIDDMFTAAVWPKLMQLPTESCQNTTPLFQLIECWSKDSCYFPLLSKENENGASLISQLLEILKQNALSNDMEKKVMIIVQNLLKSENFEESEEKGKLLTTEQSFNNDETIGIQIIKPYVPSLLQHFYGKIQSKMSNVKLKTKQKIGNIIPHIQLSILADVSKFVTDAELCEKLIDIFLPVLHCIASEDVQFNIVTTVQNLLPQTTPTERHLSLFPPLFSCFRGNKPRNILCRVYVKMSEPYPETAKIAEYVSDLNSWDAKRLEEPDYERRLAAFRSITSSFQKEEEKWSVAHILPILNNCFFFVDHLNDMSLRDASSSCIEAVFQMVSRRLNNDKETGKESGNKIFEEIVVKCVLPSIVQGLKLKNSVPRHEHIHFLELLIKTFDHSCLADLKELTTDDPETDFFQNIKHVQMHRRIRAVHQLTAKCAERKLSNKTLFTYLMPMITHFIHENLSKSKDHNLLTATIEAIGAIVHGFPWSKYCNVLKHYLTVLKKERLNQKTFIRVVVVLLNNFPFDLSNVNIEPAVDQQMKPNEPKDKKKDVISKDEDTEEKPQSKDDKEENMETDSLEEIEDEQNEEDEENGAEVATRSKQVDQKAAEHIVEALSTKILPKLHKFFTKKSRVESFHKKSNNHAEDEQDILKVPVAFAIVKLLQHLPRATLMSNLSGILLRVSQSLKSQARDVRDIARDTLKKIASSLGSSYLNQVFREMKSVLQRGYQLHVLGFTVHSILENMQSEMKAGDLDNCVTLIMQIVCEELFGTVAEEKTVQGIVGKLFEAKSKKSNELIEVVSTFITSGSFSALIGPLKEVLDTTQDHKTRRKVEEAFRRVSVGLLHNTGVSPEDHILFIHGTISNTVSILFGKRNNRFKKAVAADTKDGDKMNHPNIVREDIYLMPDQPSRTGVAPSLSKFTNEHVLVEFGLQQLHTGLKRSKFTATNDEHCRMLDPFVEILVRSLTSKHTRLVTLTMRCVALLVKFPLPALKGAIPEITKQIFKLIKKYARAGSAKGDNYEMIMTSFKTMTIIIRDGKEHKVSTKQLQILMTYVEEDIYDSSRQATALPLLKAILMRRLPTKEIADTMEKIAELSIRDEDNSIRLQCRQLMMTYLIEYPLGKKMSKHFDFYISNLSYEEETGRTSSLEMFAVMFNKFPDTVLQEYSTYFFIPLVMMLINDDSSLCKKMAASAVKLLIAKLGAGSSRSDLFDIVLNWSKQNKVQLRQAAMQLFGTFIDAEQDIDNENFKKMLDQMVPILLKTLQEGVKTDHQDADSSEDESEAEETENETDEENHPKGGVDKVLTKKLPLNDKCLYNTLTCVGKIFTKIPGIFTSGDYQANEFLGLITELLLHSHAWVRLSASQLFAVYFSITPAEEIVSASSQSYLSFDTQAKVKDLCLIFYEQLKDDQLTKEIADQATKNLIYLFKIVKDLNKDTVESSNNISDDKIHNNNTTTGEDLVIHHQEDYEIQTKKHNINVKVLITKMTRLATFEALKETKGSLKRTCVFRWIAAICLDNDHEKLLLYLPDLLKPLYREISNVQKNESDLVKLAHEVLELIRSQFDKQTFAEVYAKVQKMAHEKRDSRKRKLAVEAVTDPEKHALRKQKLNLAKREQKKRKLYERKPDLKFKKIRSQQPSDE